MVAINWTPRTEKTRHAALHRCFKSLEKSCSRSLCQRRRDPHCGPSGPMHLAQPRCHPCTVHRAYLRASKLGLGDFHVPAGFYAKPNVRIG